MDSTPAGDAPAIEVDGLVKRYGDHEAVRGIDLHVERGEVVALLGPNGAGKTTTVEILEGGRRATEGTVRVLGRDPATADDRWRSRIGIVHQESTPPAELTPRELLGFQACLFPAPIDVEEALRLVDLVPQGDQRAGTLSGGQQRRLDVALGLIGDPELVFLDEPTTGLDPEARRASWALVRQLTERGTTILLTTHYLEEAEVLADRVAVVVGGRIVASGTPADLGGRGGAEARVTFRPPVGAGPLPILDGRSEVGDDGVVTVHTDRPTAAIEALAPWARAAGAPELAELVVARPTLEEVYLGLVARHAVDADADAASTDRSATDSEEVPA